MTIRTPICERFGIDVFIGVTRRSPAALPWRAETRSETAPTPAAGNPARVAAIGTVTDVRPVVFALARTMEKLHHDRGVVIDIDAAEGARFRGEQQDLEEMVGNLVDNACKWAASQVSVEVLVEPSEEPDDDGHRLRIIVDDDGRGLSEAERAKVSRRGQRLDESKPGSGLGLSIVVDLAALYGGSLALGDAPIGGLRAELVLPGI